jgi:ATP-dependent protease ClpP protease subunit
MNRIEIRGVIVDSYWDGDWAKQYIERGLLTPESAFRRNLGKIKGEAEVYINSPGGSVFAGYEMLNALTDWVSSGNKAVIKIGAMAASAASMFAVLSGLKIVAHRNSKFMFHGAWTGAIGGSQALKDEAELLDKINGEIKTALISKYNLDPKRVEEWFAEGRMGWLTAAEAKEIGMVSEIVGQDDQVIKFSEADLALEQRGMKLAAFIEAIQIQNLNPEGTDAGNQSETGGEENTGNHDPNAAGNNPPEGANPGSGTPQGNQNSLNIDDCLKKIEDIRKENDKLKLEKDASEQAYKKQLEAKDQQLSELNTKISSLESDLEKRDQLISKIQSERDQFRSQQEMVEAKLGKLLQGGMTFHTELDSWEEALAACDGDYVKARKQYPNLFKKFMKQ